VAKAQNKPNDYDVLIVGAGPSGLALGLQLARYGVKFQIIDKKSTFTSQSLAFAIQGSTLTALADLGVADGLLQLGAQVRKVNAYINGNPSFDIDYKQSTPSAFPFMLSIEQAKTERLLSGALQQQGHHITWNAELLSFTQTKDGVVAEVAQDGKKVTTTAAWIVGCDGVDSTVRKQLGLAFQGNSHTEKFIMADLAIDWSLIKNEGYAFLHPSDIFTVFPLPNDLYRVITTQDGIKHDGEPTISDLVTKFQKLCPVLGSLTSPIWIQGYEVQRRITSKMRVKHAFLVGDAAHVHSPIGGQGLNTGIQDAYNLGWKLGTHIQGLVDESFLASYENERLDVAKAVLANTNLAMNIVMTHSKAGQLVRDIIAPLILNYPAAQKQLKRIIADLPVSYGRSHILHTENASGQGLARKIKDSFMGGVNIGDTAPNFDLQQPKDYKRLQLIKLLQGPKHVIFVMLGEKSKEFRAQYENFSRIKTAFKDFAEAYFIVGEHAIDYNTFDPNLTDVFIDPDGRGHDIYNCQETTLYLLRPDGYVSFKGLADEAILRSYLEKHFNLVKYKLDNQVAQGKTVDMAI
jgi:2-polyprenyl-6-methoxyphenol hydroxylase-like FAD-dependent oxidoreductase